MTIKVEFEFQTEYGVYRDALYLADDHAYSEEEIDAMKQERVDNWIAVITAPPPPPLPEDTVVDSIPADAVLVEDSPVGAI
jgi:hypothetical protein